MKPENGLIAVGKEVLVEAVAGQSAEGRLLAKGPSCPRREHNSQPPSQLLVALRPAGQGAAAPSNAQMAELVAQARDPMAGFEDKSGAGKRAALEQTAPQSRKDWHAQIRDNATLAATPLLDAYLGEESNRQSAELPTQFGAATAEGTHYAKDASEYGTATQGGKLMKGSSLDSGDARKLWVKDKDQRVNFAMDAAGGLYTTDPRQDLARHTQGESTARSNHCHSLAVATPQRLARCARRAAKWMNWAMAAVITSQRWPRRTRRPSSSSRRT